MRGLKKFLFGTAVLAGMLCLISASAFVFLRAFQYTDGRRTNAATVSAASSGAPALPQSSGAFGTGSSGMSSAGGSSDAESLPSAAQAAEKELVLVNYEHKLPADYSPDLVELDGIEMDALTAQAYRKMHDAAENDGISLWVSSGYRSEEKQEELFDREVETYEKTAGKREEAEAYAEKSVARPGYSEHITGLAIDLNGVLDSFDGTPAFRWLDAHAQEYGFILRFPKDKQEITKIKYEPWHYRYVGIENAKAMKEKNLCLEEYLDSIGKNGSAN